MYETKIATLKSDNTSFSNLFLKLKSDNSKTLRKHANDVAELTSTRSLLNDSRKDCSKLKIKVEKLELLTNKKQEENEGLKNQVTEQVNNKIEYEKLKKCQKQLLKEYKTQIVTIENYETAAEESKTEVDVLNVTVADLNYALKQAREARINAKTVLNGRIERLKSENQELKNALSIERMKVERLEKIKIENDTIKLDNKLDESKKNLFEKVKVLEKSNAVKKEQIIELSSQLADQFSDLDERERDATAAKKDSLEKVKFWKEEAERQFHGISEFKMKMADSFGGIMNAVDKLHNLELKELNYSRGALNGGSANWRTT